MYIHWHRRDLRLADNRGLAAAESACGENGGGVLPVFLFDSDVLAHAGPPRVAFLIEAVSALRDAYRDRGGDLLVARGGPREALPALAEEYGAEGVTWGRDYSGLARERDAAVSRALDAAGVARKRVHDSVFHEPGTITTNDDEPYSVFTYYGEKWHDRPKADPVSPPTASALAAVEDPGTVPTLAELGFGEPEADVPPASTAAARDRLSSFRAGPIYRYGDQRNYPAEDCTSRLSPHLKFGTIGIREVHAATEAARAEAEDGAARESVEAFQDQLAWREFYTQVLSFNPEIVTEDYRSYEQEIEWHEDPEGLRAWKDGETGYPIVDAGMRQLREEAWMHNRVRMIVASFLTKDLLVDWRRGYEWFRQKLVDHDTANDNGGWQWAASTGTDAQPYFRIFNPATQCQRHDPDGEYVRRYVPALRDADTETIHQWPDLPAAERERAAPEYPAPIVDHAERREAALEMFERARGET